MIDLCIAKQNKFRIITLCITHVRNLKTYLARAPLILAPSKNSLIIIIIIIIIKIDINLFTKNNFN